LFKLKSYLVIWILREASKVRVMAEVKDAILSGNKFHLWAIYEQELIWIL